MNIGTLYTLYGRRAGAELLFEKTVELLTQAWPEDQWTIFCNREASRVLSERVPSARQMVIPWLDNQLMKAFWLECLARKSLQSMPLDVFWIPSGANSFPGPWPIPSLVTFLDLGEFFVKNKYDFKRTVYRKHICIPRSVRRAAAFTSISRSTATDLQNLFPQAKPAGVIYPGPSPQQALSARPQAEDIIEKETQHSFKRILFSPARTDYKGKGRDILLQAYARYRTEVSDPLPLVMPGPPGEHHELMLRDIQALKLESHAIWPGRVSDQCIEALYSISAAMIMPSRYEGFGFPLLEAMARGVPVICSDAGSLPEIAGDAALIFPSGQAEALLKALREIHHPQTARRLIQLGDQQVKKFSWEQYAQQMRTALKETLRSR